MPNRFGGTMLSMTRRKKPPLPTPLSLAMAVADLIIAAGVVIYEARRYREEEGQP